MARGELEWVGTDRDRAMGAWLARTFFGFGVAYAVVVVAGFVSLGNVRDPLRDRAQGETPRRRRHRPRLLSCQPATRRLSMTASVSSRTADAIPVPGYTMKPR